MLKDSFVLDCVTISLQERESTKGGIYLACILTVDGVDYMLGFEKEYYSLRKRFNKIS